MVQGPITDYFDYKLKIFLAEISSRNNLNSLILVGMEIVRLMK